MDEESPTISDDEGRGTRLDEVTVTENPHIIDGQERQDITLESQYVHTLLAGTSKLDQELVDVNKSAGTDEPSSRNRSISIDDDISMCPICLSNWTNIGEHRVCALKCGHLFCLKCITHWFVSQMNNICPSCKKTASKSDLRYLRIPTKNNWPK